MDKQHSVKYFYKTGTYIGEIVENHKDRVIVKTLAVLKHPTQGDLHSPNQVDVPFFHERKALAKYEKCNILQTMTRPYNDKIPEYSVSLVIAFNELIEQLTLLSTPFANKSKEMLLSIKEEYKQMYQLDSF